VSALREAKCCAPDGARTVVHHPLPQRRIWLLLSFALTAASASSSYGAQVPDTSPAFNTLFQSFYPEVGFPHADPELFGTVRSVIDPQHVGYLLRVPGMYDPSAIDLWVYDARAMRFARPIRVAEAWGDAGCYSNLETVFVDINADHRLDLVLHQGTGCVDLRTGRTRSETDSLWIRSWTRGAFSSSVVSSDSLLAKLLRQQRSRVR
jgi:hypothetical protein